MGVLDKLFFWRDNTVELDTDIEGCFTLPGAEIGQVPPPAEQAETCAVDDGETLDGGTLDAASGAVGDEGHR